MDKQELRKLYALTIVTLASILLAIYIAVLMVNFLFVKEFEWLNTGLYSLALIGAYFVVKVFDNSIEATTDDIKKRQEAADTLQMLIANIEEQLSKEDGDDK